MEQTLIEYFDDSEVNQKLLKLFESKWEAVNKVYDALQEEEEWAVLHLACVPPNYEKMKYKILIVGQENNGYGYETEPKKSMLFTLDFQNGRYYDNAPFFSFPYSFCASINDCDNEKYSKKSYLAWVNLKEFSFETSSKKPLNEKAQNIIDNEYNILEEEIKIINPDIVLFLTGPYYDYYIEKQLKGVEFKTIENYGIRQFARVEHKSLPKNSFRIYHPVYLRRRGLENNYLEKLKKECGL
ncbi:hypothetical protein EPJ69_07585 [Brachyspira aalborgi]|uniref:Uracil-DNA glycosylase n=1 Tax=Brachyspira aalborgi TaxID=29522 RepID=A0A5C8E2I1_9SPIR|nr:hypothetical protein [Brachyspira aalborgi]TXJ31488.1 hypothetical protein EPJ69_07585 [Brachyspira aalborgi]